MGVSLECPSCRSKLNVPEKLGDRRIVCPLCAKSLRPSAVRSQELEVVRDDEGLPERPSINVTVKHVSLSDERPWLLKHLVEVIVGACVTVATTVLLAYFGLADRESRQGKSVLADPAPTSTPKIESTSQPPAKVASRGMFIGRWKMINDKGVTASYLTVTALSAERDHVRGVPAKWEVVGKDARISWDDGYRDIMRIEEGRISYHGLGKSEFNWEVQPLFKLQAIRMAGK